MKKEGQYIYQGEFRSGEMHGLGKMTYANGNVFWGEFKSGLQNGQGVLKHSDGHIH